MEAELTLKKILGYFLNPNAGLSLLGNFLGLFFQCLGSFCVTQILGQRNAAVGLFIAGILHPLLESAVLSIELKRFFGKYRFVYILFY